MHAQPAMTEKFMTASPGDSVESVLKAMKKAKVEVVPVIDDEDCLVGVFSLQILMKNLLPVTVALGGGISPDVKLTAAPGIARRLNKIHTLTIGELMDRKVAAITPEMPLWEAVNFLVQNSGPLIVTEQGTGKVIGMITAQSALDELNRLKDSES